MDGIPVPSIYMLPYLSPKRRVNVSPENESIREDMEEFQFWWLAGMGSKNTQKVLFKRGRGF